jgi:hypothetical protein
MRFPILFFAVAVFLFNLIEGARADTIVTSGAPQTGATAAQRVDTSSIGAVTMTVGAVYAPGRGIGVVATVAGNVSILMADGSTIVVPVATGWTRFEFSAQSVNTSGTTATATYYSLK